MKSISDNRTCFIDTGVFYRSTKPLVDLVNQGFSFYINSIVYYEFINTIQDKLNKAHIKRNKNRSNILENLQERFSELLSALNINLIDYPIDWKKTNLLLEYMKEYGMNIGDILIYETIKYYNIDQIVSTDKDWKRTNIKVLII